MPDHFVRGVTQPAQGGVYGVFAHAAVASAQTREKVLAGAGHGLQCHQYGKGLVREGRDIRLSHLHLLGRDAPVSGACVELGPFCPAQLFRPDKDQRRQLEGASRGELPGVRVYDPQQFGYLPRFGQGCMVFGLDWLQRSPQIGGRVAFGPSGGDGVAEYLPGVLAGLVGGARVYALG